VIRRGKPTLAPAELPTSGDRRSQPVPNADGQYGRILELLREGHSMTAIAEITGIGYKRVNRLRKAHRLPTVRASWGRRKPIPTPRPDAGVQSQEAHA
jgi:hypothetical protein